MSKRASMVMKQEPKATKRKGVRFTDELVFLDNMKENDIAALDKMLKRVSLQMDISGLNAEGLTPLHQAILDGNEDAVRLLIEHDVDINKKDSDSWTPLHAACACGHTGIVRILLDHGADRRIETDDGELPMDLIEPDDLDTLRVMFADVDDDDHDPDDDDSDAEKDVVATEDVVTHF